MVPSRESVVILNGQHVCDGTPENAIEMEFSEAEPNPQAGNQVQNISSIRGNVLATVHFFLLFLFAITS